VNAEWPLSAARLGRVLILRDEKYFCASCANFSRRFEVTAPYS
jgi:hypothetical protein